MKEEENREIKEKMGKSLIQISNPKKLKKKHQKKLDKVFPIPDLSPSPPHSSDDDTNLWKIMCPIITSSVCSR
jgi:hypothetical protein